MRREAFLKKLRKTPSLWYKREERVIYLLHPNGQVESLVFLGWGDPSWVPSIRTKSYLLKQRSRKAIAFLGWIES